MVKAFLASCSTLKLVILALLTVNIFIFAEYDSLVSAVDALSWVLLLIMFDLESLPQASLISTKIRSTIRNALIIVIAAVFLIYMEYGEWLNVSNAILWFILIFLLEIEIRWPALVQKYPKLYWLATLSVFLGLLGMVGIWLSRAFWLDAYDAILWIVAFALLEVDIFSFLKIKKT